MQLKDIFKEFKLDPDFKYPNRPRNKPFNKFYWWRRYPTHHPIGKHKPIIEQIKNGDFDYSPYWAQANWEEYWMCEDIYKIRRFGSLNNRPTKEQEDHIILISKRRIKRLREDAMKDEYLRMESFKAMLKRFYGGDKEYIDEFINNFQGTLEHVDMMYSKILKQHKQLELNKRFESWGI